MVRVAVVVPDGGLRAALVGLAGAGVVQVDVADRAAGAARPAGGGDGGAVARLRRLAGAGVAPRLAARPPDLDGLVRDGRADLLAGEAELDRVAAAAVRDGAAAALAGWCPERELPGLARRLAGAGAAVVRLPAPPGAEPPTLLAAGGALHRSAAPLVRTYGTVPYADVDPTVGAGLAYALMFGMMFADAGHGLLLVVLGGLLRLGRVRRLARWRSLWPFVTAAGLASTVFGALFGEFFGPTGVVPALWLAPVRQPASLMVAAVGVGAVLLAVSYAVGSVNRWREGGLRWAVYAPSGFAGAALFVGLGALGAGVYTGLVPLTAVGGVVMVAALAFAGWGYYAASGGRAMGATVTAVELLDLVLRLGTNLVSFARLAAFGLTHAVLGALVWSGTVALARAGGAGWVAAAGVALAGNAVAFGLEALVAGIQALRLEYYELFSRVFEGTGQEFRPWRIPVATPEAGRGGAS